MSPFRDAVGFIDREQADSAAPQPTEKSLVGEPLGGVEQEIDEFLEHHVDLLERAAPQETADPAFGGESENDQRHALGAFYLLDAI